MDATSRLLIRAQVLTDEAFAPYGDIIKPRMSGEQFDRTHSYDPSKEQTHVKLVMTNGVPTLRARRRAASSGYRRREYLDWSSGVRLVSSAVPFSGHAGGSRRPYRSTSQSLCFLPCGPLALGTVVPAASARHLKMSAMTLIMDQTRNCSVAKLGHCSLQLRTEASD